MRKIFLSVAVLAFASTSALASQCPALIKKIDETMASKQLDDATKHKVTDLRDKGKAAHDGGDHAASEAALNDALKLME